MTQTLRAAALALSLGAALVAACESPGPIEAYCDVYGDCYANYDVQDCVSQRETQEQSMIQVGHECHEAFLAFHECVGTLGCDELFAYTASGLYCGVAEDEYEAACYTF